MVNYEKKYTINGKKVNENEWEDSTEDGVHRIHYKNKLEHEIPYKQGKKHGIACWWHKNGQLAYKIALLGE